nr:nuclear transport factor 2 family protein [uncultured Pseudomonas sp.]
MSVSKAWPESAIHALEVRLLERESRLDRDILESLLAPDFVEFGADGAVWNRTQIIDALLEQDFVQRQINDFQIRILSEKVVLTTYLCTVRSSSGNSESLRSSIWRQVGDGWQMAFHQGTVRARK